jgi:hypothetical protein
MALTALVGFEQSAGVLQSSDQILYPWDSDPIDPQPAVLALFLQSDAGAHPSANNRRIDVTETLREGGTVVAALGINGEAELALEFGSWLKSRFGFSVLDAFVSETIGLDGIEEAFRKMERGEMLRSVVVLADADEAAAGAVTPGEPGAP